MVVKIVQEIDLSVKMVEEAASKPKSLVEETDGANDGRGEEILKPLQTRIGNWYAK